MEGQLKQNTRRIIMKQYIVDAFTDKVFAGNPAAVCILNQWLSDEIMQKIAIENNLSETAFAVREKENYRLRWFTPAEKLSFAVTQHWQQLM